MFVDDEVLGIRPHKTEIDNRWALQDTGNDRMFRAEKRFVRCICPRCAEHHSVYMLWTGRGTPRKYCANCRPVISSYDDAGIYEASISAPGHSRKKGGRRVEAE